MNAVPHDDASRDRAVHVVTAIAALLVVALHASSMTRYGYFRDELYYLACAQHPAFGYVDHPPFSVAVLTIVRATLGTSLVALRLVPMLANVAVLALTGAMVRALRGGAFAAALACFTLALAPIFLAFGTFYSMNDLDAVFWALAAWLFFRVLRAPTTTLWCALGVVLGLGLENKVSVLWLGAGIALALLVYRRDLLATRGPWIAGAIAAVLFAPNVLWEIAHRWPTLEFMRHAMEEKYKAHSLFGFLKDLADEMSPASMPVFFVGLAAPFAMDRLRPFRPLACALAVTVLIVVSSRTAKAEYLAASFPIAFAPAGVAVEAWLTRWPRARWTLLAPIVARAALSVPFVVPILPIDRFLAYQTALGAAPTSAENKEIGPLPQLYADMFGWPELADAAAVAVATLTPGERAHAGVLSRTGYGAAAAIELLGPSRGLPHGISGHNNFYLWGPRDFDGTALILLGGTRAWAEEHFTSVVEATTYDCPLCMPYERHKTIYVARGLKGSLADFWEDRRYYE